ncbi:MAG: rhodanese-like domain-containing protein [Thiobacillaceae bacterium]
MDFILQNIWLVLLAVVSGLMLIWPSVSGRILGVKQVGPQEAVMLLNHEDALILDVREDSEYRDGRIPKARHIPLRQLKDRLKDLEKYKDRAIVAVCRTGSRSSHACRLLRQAGYERVHNLAGGMVAWEQAGLPKEK